MPRAEHESPTIQQEVSEWNLERSEGLLAPFLSFESRIIAKDYEFEGVIGKRIRTNAICSAPM